jgi:hypothetical protein
MRLPPCRKPLLAWEAPMAADINLPELHAELLRTITLARKAHDEYMAAYRAAGGRDEQHRLADIGHAITDTINVAQGCLYTVSYAMRAQEGT